ncbi:undecaprenyldiphospho-muramoylpentapeptide beta-N-acetylglucosaminyltransferase [Simiduia sp. 21SJ11W-1]|uniref:undecaprenyldiphospho-muramoylpentapeptide beta-N-acetylglucosaminyltransferase n=1 Tax=Simiduia sp. 21SJ11W-1 TaxID=2909669 RepID=UPI003531FD53
MRKSLALMMAGGTGGHVFPALAVADVLRARGFEVQWLGTARGIEARLVPEAGIALNTISVEGLRGKGKLALLSAPFKLLKSLWQSLCVVRGLRPDVVVGFGGFASGPGGVAAWLLNTPLVIHEQNAFAGTTNRWLARIASRTLEAFASGLPNAVCVGNPVREAIANVPAPGLRYKNRSGALRVLVLGGSLGAQAINDVMPKVCGAMPVNSLEVRHQAGTRNLAECQQAYCEVSEQTVEITAFIDDMAEAYAWADIVLCRAGALTVSEIASVGVPAVFIPFPHAIDDHQTANAQWLVQAGAAWLMPQASLSVDRLCKLFQQVGSDRPLLVEMANKARAQAMPGAAQAVADVCQEVMNG